MWQFCPGAHAAAPTKRDSSMDDDWDDAALTAQLRLLRKRRRSSLERSSTPLGLGRSRRIADTRSARKQQPRLPLQWPVGPAVPVLGFQPSWPPLPDLAQSMEAAKTWAAPATPALPGPPAGDAAS